MRKREEFAVSLRKKRTKEIIKEKRLKLQSVNNQQKLKDNAFLASADYDGYESILTDKAEFNRLLLEIAPRINEQTNIVSYLQNDLICAGCPVRLWDYSVLY